MFTDNNFCFSSFFLGSYSGHSRLLFSCQVMCDSFVTPMNCSPLASSVHGILQARILEWVALLLQGIFPTHGWNVCFQNWQADSLPLSPQGITKYMHIYSFIYPYCITALLECKLKKVRISVYVLHYSNFRF